MILLVPDKVSFPEEELKILDFWKTVKAFETQLKLTESCKPYTFYDGPPFATGTPHYGNLLAGTVKDICTRYATQNGHYVKRRFGWDCHGLPVEYEVDKKLNLHTPKEHIEFGIGNYNNECRKIVMRYSGLWRDIVARFGRWIDFDNDYKTMDLNYMESVWWVFKQLFEKGLVYRSSRVMPFSTACGTVLSNFEAHSNYKENTPDPSLVVSFPLIKRPDVKILAWTTTPWTLPSNLALSVHPEFDYILFEEPKTKEKYICGKPHLEEVKKELHIPKDAKINILESYKGKDMAGWEYEPLFPYFESLREKGCFRVITAEFVTSDTGTGIVHTAPGFGEDDFYACCKAGIIRPDAPACPVDDNGVFTDPVTDFKGMYIKDADPLIKEYLKKTKRLLASATIKHSYPYCWRSDTPLIYRAVQAWFIKVTAIKEDLLTNNMKSRWVPANIQEKRFHNWLHEARDWCFSRNRYWGNPIPLWVSDDFEEVVAVGSIKELMELAGIKEPLTDIHRDFIDHITIPSKKGKGVLHRVSEVFDCWFESGSMPFAHCHYPFDIKEEDFAKIFPSDFIAEGLDQTRGWFYTLLVLSTAVKNSHCFKNLIVHGLVLAEDGKKMSKHLHNYTDPMELANKAGADAIRLYMINSPVVKAEGLKFSNKGVEAVVREVLLPWYNAYRFMIQNITRWEMMTGKTFIFDEKVKEKMLLPEANIMDRWITAANQNLIKFIRNEMENYRLYTVVPKLLKFLEQLTNGYVRLNRSRLKGATTADDWNVALNILFDVLVNTTIMMCSYTPFTSELLYQNLKRGISPSSAYYAESIHYLRIPEYNAKLINEEIEKQVSQMQNVILLGRTIRDRKKLPVKQPLSTLTVVSKDPKMLMSIKKLEKYVAEELNVLAIEYKENESDYVTYKIGPNFQAIGERLGKPIIKVLRPVIEKMNEAQIREYALNGSIKLKDNEGKEYELLEGEIIIDPTFAEKYSKDPDCGCASNLDGCVLINIKITDELNKTRIAREVANHIQMVRKEAGVNIEDAIDIYYSIEGAELKSIVETNMGTIRQIVKVPVLEFKHMPRLSNMIYKDQYETTIVPNAPVQRMTYMLSHCHVAFDVEAIKTKMGKVKTAALNKALKKVMETPYAEVRKELEKGNLKVEVDKKEVTLERGKEVFADIEEYLKSKK